MFLLGIVAPLVAVASSNCQAQAEPTQPQSGPIAFTQVPRKIVKPPPLVSSHPLYGLFLFGPKGETRVWAILDATTATSKEHDVLWIDLDADGDLVF